MDERVPVAENEPDVPESFDLDVAPRPETIAQLILRAFIEYYHHVREFPGRAQEAFETRDAKTSLALSRKRLSLYVERIKILMSTFEEVSPPISMDEGQWERVEKIYLELIEGWYEADLATAFIHSLRRWVYEGEWHPVDYVLAVQNDSGEGNPAKIHLDFPGGSLLTAETVVEILAIPDFTAPFRNIKEDARRVAERVNRTLGLDGADGKAIRSVQMIDAGFFRNRGAYLVGRLVINDERLVPFIIALLNDENGIYVDAVLNSKADPHNVFSSTLANFHVTNRNYHEICQFLHSIMPVRPLGLHYSTIGFNHTGKVAVFNELCQQMTAANEVLDTAPGFRGTVAIGFSAPSSAYALKVIRDKPTANYKWGEFAGTNSVIRKYRQVHEIKRSGSMLDNIIYVDTKLHQRWFKPALLDELLHEAPISVFMEGDLVLFRHLIVQRRLTPLPIFLEKASPEDAETAIINLGHCIKNNTAANIFNRDLDGRNYGVSQFLKVFLFDYDALEPFTEVKIRSNLDCNKRRGRHSGMVF